jgi:hypothetical protein
MSTNGMDTISGAESKNYRIPVREKQYTLLVITGFRREVNENSVLLSYYAASSGNSLPTFRCNLPVPSSRIKTRPMDCTKTSAINYRYSLRNDPEECSSALIHFIMTRGFLGVHVFSPTCILLLFALFYFVVLKKNKEFVKILIVLLQNCTSPLRY